MQSLLTEIALADANDITRLERVINVSDTFDEATSFGYSTDYTRIEVKNKQSLPYKVYHEFVIIGLPTSNVTVSNLEHFTDPNTDVIFSALGVDMGIVCQDSVKCEFLEKPQEGRVWRFKICFETVPYREKDTGRKGGGLHAGENLLQIYSWGDVDSDNVPNGFAETASVGASSTFSSGEYEVSAPDGESIRSEFEDILFPFSGQKVTTAFDVGSYQKENGHPINVGIEFVDNANQVLQTDEEDVSSSGRKVISSNIPTGTVYIRFFIDIPTNTGLQEVTIADPSIQVGSKSDFVAY